MTVAMIPVKLRDTMEAPGPLPGTFADGKCATCTLCDHSAAAAHERGRSKAFTGREAIRALARTCPGDALHWYYPNKLPAGLRLEWTHRGRRLPLHLIGSKLIGGGGPVGKRCPVHVVALDESKGTIHAARTLAARLRGRGFDARMERAIAAESTPAGA